MLNNNELKSLYHIVLDNETKQNPDGFSFRLNKYGRKIEPKEGYMVSITPTVIEGANFKGVSKKLIVKHMVSYFKDIDDLYIGGWNDGKRDYFDLSLNVKTLEEAIEIGKQNNQLAIFDLQTFESIEI